MDLRVCVNDKFGNGDDSLGKGAKWQKKSEKTTIQANLRASRVMEGVYFCAPSDEHWPRLIQLMQRVLGAVQDLTY